MKKLLLFVYLWSLIIIFAPWVAWHGADEDLEENIFGGGR